MGSDAIVILTEWDEYVPNIVLPDLVKLNNEFIEIRFSNNNVINEINFFIDAQGHPFYLKLVPGVGKKNQVQNIPNNGTSSGKITWKPEKEGTYYYQCSKHKNMTGKIVILAFKK